MSASSSSTGWVAELCLESPATCPGELLETIFADERCPAFGPLHHFIAGAVLLTCIRNGENAPDRSVLLQKDLAQLSDHSSCVPGGACATWGICGAAASVGMAHAIVAGNAPLKREGWSEGQRLVAQILESIAGAGAPRCCKRDTRIAVAEASRAFAESPACRIEPMRQAPLCLSAEENSVCLGGACPYHLG